MEEPMLRQLLDLVGISGGGGGGGDDSVVCDNFLLLILLGVFSGVLLLSKQHGGSLRTLILGTPRRIILLLLPQIEITAILSILELRGKRCSCRKKEYSFSRRGCCCVCGEKRESKMILI
ncbi:hypothetical protein JHK86_053520 [Glycine max]|nr:hypothetical protein JHK86_053520 [Glycine max]